MAQMFLPSVRCLAIFRNLMDQRCFAILLETSESLYRKELRAVTGTRQVGVASAPCPRRSHDEVLSKLWSANEFALAPDNLLAHAIHWLSSIGVPG
jgi:hypothetical protein